MIRYLLPILILLALVGCSEDGANAVLPTAHAEGTTSTIEEGASEELASEEPAQESQEVAIADVTEESEALEGASAEEATESSQERGKVAQSGQLLVTHGPISGEVSDSAVVLWARANTNGMLEFEVDKSEAFAAPLRLTSVAVDETSDFTGEVRVEGLKPSQDYFYRVRLTADDKQSKAVTGHFRTAPAADSAEGFTFLFGSCLGGQGYCRDKETGWFIFETMAASEPDFFLLTGDSIYATGTCNADNVVPGAEGPYYELEGFRTRYRYHLEDAHYANFLSETPIYVTWDDHEIMNDAGGPALETINPQRFADAVQAYFEYWPLMRSPDEPHRIYRQFSYGSHADFFILDTRSYRDPNVNWDPNPRTLAPKSMLGSQQFAWLQESLAASQATWKFIVTSVPLSYPTGFPQPEVDGRDGWANYTERSGYESELMALLFYLESQEINNVLFLTGDTHWPFAMSYDPDHDGKPNFYELATSPLSAITLPPPETPDPTFNPTILYAEGEFQSNLFNFGELSMSKTGDLTFRVVDREGTEHYSLTLEPQ